MFRTFFVYFPLAVFVLTMLAFVVPASRALRLGTRAQAVSAMFLLLCFSKFLCYKAFGGDEFNPDLPVALIWIWNWLYSGAMLLFAFSVALFFLPRRVKPFLLPSLAWILAAWGVWNGIKIPDVREVEIACPGLPAALDGYRIVQIADIHVSSAAPRWRTEAVVAKANAANADLVVCTGDIVDGSPRRRRRDVEPLKELKAKDGVYYVTGNHEFYGDREGWKVQYDKWGFRFLRNECVFPREGLALGGVDDDAIFRWCESGPEPDVGKAFASATNGEFRVLLQHKPQFFDDNVSLHGVGLQLSGHTHGGVMPGLNLLVLAHNGGYVRGIYGVNAGDAVPARPGRIYVSPGCGQWAGFPIRFFDDPEVSVITLRCAANPPR
jgi:hypothetical protein